MKAIEQLRAKLARVGATLEDDGYALHCDAPAGYTWRANGCRCISIHYATNAQQWLVKAIREDMDRLQMGLDKVTDPEELAMHQHEIDDDNWKAAPEAPERIEWRMETSNQTNT